MCFRKVYQHIFLLSTITLMIQVFLVRAIDYCDKSLCRSAKHIACGNDGNFLSQCPSDARLLDMAPYIDLILKECNSRRNNLAGGKISGYDTAKRMATIKWNSELASLAALNVKKCKLLHDECWSTFDYKYPGQTLFLSMGGKWSPDRKINKTLSKAVSQWWSENLLGNMKLISRIIYGSTKYQKIGHFAILATDDNDAMGCAVSRYTKDFFAYTLFVCNFARMHLPGKSVYEVGDPASGCKTGSNPEYKNLCSSKEVYE